MKFFLFTSLMFLFSCTHSNKKIAEIELNLKNTQLDLKNLKEGFKSHVCGLNYFGCKQTFPEKEEECKKIALDCFKYLK